MQGGPNGPPNLHICKLKVGIFSVALKKKQFRSLVKEIFGKKIKLLQKYNMEN